MHILDKIVAHKKVELVRQKIVISIKDLEQRHYFSSATPSLKNSILSHQHGGIIAEFKRKSPSKQNINLKASVSGVTRGYENAGVAGISVLTDKTFFGGSSVELLKARTYVTKPLLRKEFIIDPYQIVEAKAIGAAAILLIARILSKQEMMKFTRMAQSLGLEVLIEIHNQKELDKCPADMDIIGVNNRDLDTFEVSYENSVKLKNQLPASLCKISESGILNTETMVMLRDKGFDGFLIGEMFMRNHDPGKACKEFVKEYLRKMDSKNMNSK